jgi:hypothetical protein
MIDCQETWSRMPGCERRKKRKTSHRNGKCGAKKLKQKLEKTQNSCEAIGEKMSKIG